MAKKLPVKSKGRQNFEDVLRGCAVGYGLFHLLLLLCYYLLRAMPLYQSLNALDPWLALVLAVAGLGYLGYVFFRFPWERSRLTVTVKRFFSLDQLLLTLLFVWALIGCMVLQSGRNDFFSWVNDQGQQVQLNYEAVFRLNDSRLLDMAVSIFVLYPMVVMQGKIRVRKVLHWFTRVIVLIATVFMVWVLVNYVSGHLIYLLNGGLQIGPDASGYLSLNCNTNTTGAFAAVFLMISLYLVFTEKKGWLRGIYVFAAAVQLCPLYLSGSRAALYSVTAGAAVIGFRFVWDRVSAKLSSSMLKRIAVSAAAAVVCAALILVLNPLVCKGLTSARNSITGSGNEQTGSSAAMTAQKKGDSERFDVWSCTLKATFANGQNAVTGVTPGLVELAIGIELGNTEDGRYAHNQFLQMLLAFGLPGLGLFVAWLVCIAKKCARVGMKTAQYVLPAAVLMLLAANMFESYLVAYSYFGGSAFFLLCGAVKALDPGRELPKTEKR